MKRLFRLAATLATLLPLAASASGPEDAARAALFGYRHGKADGMLQIEMACWKRATRATVIDCTNAMIAGGVIDMSMQRAERRGGAPSFAPAQQRARFQRETARIGLQKAESQALLESAMSESLPGILQTLADSGL